MIVFNQQCGSGNPHRALSPECAMKREKAKAQYTNFIAVASQYKSQGTGCRAILRQRIIQDMIRNAHWNLDCWGVRATGCAQEKMAIKREGQAISREIQNCIGSGSL